MTRTGYALSAAGVFLVEVAIALFARDAFVRPYVGDALAVVLVYLVPRAATRLGVTSATATVLAHAVGPIIVLQMEDRRDRIAID